MASGTIKIEEESETEEGTKVDERAKPMAQEEHVSIIAPVVRNLQHNEREFLQWIHR